MGDVQSQTDLQTIEDRAPRRILITGGAGFIGSNFVRFWCDRYPQDHVVVLDALTYAGNRANLDGLKLEFVHGNICDRPLVDTLLQQHQIDTTAHFAAESHVDRSILGPGAFVQTNVVGTFTLLEAFRQYWMERGQPEGDRFLHVSTDEVFGSLGAEDPAFSELTAYAPNSPYSASKAGSDHLVRSYFHTYGLPTLVTNCSNNYGPYHFPEKLIPLCCINILLGKPLPIYGDGLNVRDWLYVKDHCRAIDCVIAHGQPGSTYAVGGNNEVTNLALVKQLCKLMDQYAAELPVQPAESLITFVTDRPGHDRRYAINASKIRRELGWEPSVTWEEGLAETVQWYLANVKWWQPLLSDKYQEFYKDWYESL